jgi:uncharacterized protein
MILSLETMIFLAGLSLAASTVNGALGYGYSSVSTPLAILVIANRLINPAYVLLEAILNTLMLGLSGLKNVKATFRRILPIVLAVLPGVIAGSYLLKIIPSPWVKFFVYAAILPLILLQITGFRRPVRREGAAGVPMGLGVGFLYSITTISGPPIALFFNNQGLKREEFKAAIAQVRVAESYLTCISYYLLGLFTLTSIQLFGYVAPPVLIGIPLGMWIVKKVALETFRRFTMSFNATIVGFGLSQSLITLFGVIPEVAYLFWFVLLVITYTLLYRYFVTRPREERLVEKEESWH